MGQSPVGVPTAHFFHCRQSGGETIQEANGLDNMVEDRYNNLSAELKLLLLCCQPICEPEAIDYLLVSPLDWQQFVHLAVHHRMYPLVYKTLSTMSSPAVPEEVLALLLLENRKNTTKTLQMTGELVKLLRNMEQRGIRAVVLKGFPLAYQLYDDITLRPSKDLDILVWPQDIEAARAVMAERGYELTHPNFTLTPLRLQNWLKTSHHFEYWQPEEEICVELHWRLGHNAVEIPLAEIEESLAIIRIAGQAVYIPGSEQMLLYLILHGAQHAWFRLRWLCDIAIIFRQGNFSWEKAVGLAEKLNMRTLFNQAVLLSLQLLNAPIPAHIISSAVQDRTAQQLAATAITFIAEPGYNPEELSINKRLYYLMKRYEWELQSGWKCKYSSLLHKLRPKDLDISLVSLPEPLYYLYYVIRPVAWLCRRVREVAGK